MCVCERDREREKLAKLIEINSLVGNLVTVSSLKTSNDVPFKKKVDRCGQEGIKLSMAV